MKRKVLHVSVCKVMLKWCLRGKFRNSIAFTKKGRKVFVVKNLEKNNVNKKVEVREVMM